MKALFDYISLKALDPGALDLTVVTIAKKLKVSFVIMLIAFFFAPPPIEKLTYRFWLNDRYKAFSEQINGTYNSADYDMESHESKLSFRIVPSLIGKLSFSKDPQTQMIFLYIVQVIFGFFSILVLLNAIYESTKDWLFAKFIVTGLMLTHLGSSFFYDISYFLDGFPFFLMILAMFVPSAALSMLFLFIGFWCDERVLMGGAGVVLFRNYRELKDLKLWSFVFSKNAVLFLLSAAVYVGIRVWLIYYQQVSIPLGSSSGVGLSAIWVQRNTIPIAQLFTFEFYWLYIFPMLFFFFERSKTLAAFIFFYLVVAIGLTGIVMDVMRSVNYLFPVIILGIFIYYGQESRKKTNEVALFGAFMNLLIPNYRYFVHFFIVIPLPIKLIQMYFETGM